MTLVETLQATGWENAEATDSGSAIADCANYPGLTVELWNDEMYILLEDEESGEALEYTYNGLLKPSAAFHAVSEFGVEVVL